MVPISVLSDGSADFQGPLYSTDIILIAHDGLSACHSAVRYRGHLLILPLTPRLSKLWPAASLAGLQVST